MFLFAKRLRILTAVGCAGLQALGAAENFSAALIHPGDKGLVLTLYPMAGTALDAPLPAGLPRDVTVNAFSTKGNAIYLQEADYQSLEGIIKIEFKPLRKSMVDGTAGLRSIWNMAVLPSGRIVVSGISKIRGECGTFEIDPIAGKERALLAGPFPDCGGGGGAISPDGRRVVSYSGKELSVIDLGDGTVTRINGIPGQLFHSDVTWPHKASWSPDGKWISVVLKNGDILLLDASDTSKRTNLGPSEGPPAVWSPDSRHLLMSKSDCSQYLYFQSLVSIDVTTRGRQVIQSSHCRIGPGWFGWVDLEAVR
jgi:WD40 repeat protein